MNIGNCPSEQELSDLSTGQLRPEAVDTVADHLDSCFSCQQRIQSAAYSDALTEAVGIASDTDEFTEDPVYRRLATVAPWSISKTSVAGIQRRAVPPEFIAGCRIQRRLGSGGMGVVYQALQPGLGRNVAIKLLPQNRLSDHRAADRFRREMRALGRVDHENVVKAYDAGEENETAYLMMELIDGIDVRQLQHRSGKQSLADVCEIVRQAAAGLQHSHDQGLVHRDVKPSNLMIRSDGTVKVLDLGLAMLSDLHAVPRADISSRMIMGTVEYMAPEQMTSRHNVDARADIYSLGVTLYELLTGQTPWKGLQSDTLLQQLRSMALMDAPPVQSFRDDIPDDVAMLLNRMLVRDVSQRRITAAEVADVLKPHCQQSDLATLVQKFSRPDDRGTEVTEFAPSRKTYLPQYVVAFTCVLVAALVPAVFYSLLHTNNSTEEPVAENSFSTQVALPAENLTQPAAVLSGLSSNVMDLELFSDSQRCAAVTWDGALTICDLNSGSVRKVEPRDLNFDGLQDNRLNCLEISPDQKLIAVGGSVFRVHLHDAGTGRFIREIFAKDPSVHDIRFTSDSSQLFVSTANRVQIFDADGTEIAEHPIERPVPGLSSVQPLPGDEAYLLVTADGVVMRSGETGVDIATVIRLDHTSHMALSPDFTKVAAGSFTMPEKQIVFQDLQTNEELQRISLPPASGPYRCMRFLKNDQLIVGGDDRTLRIYDVSSGVEIHRIQADTFCTPRFDVTPDRKHIVSAGGWRVINRIQVDGDYRLRIWDLPDL